MKFSSHMQQSKFGTIKKYNSITVYPKIDTNIIVIDENDTKTVEIINDLTQNDELNLVNDNNNIINDDNINDNIRNDNVEIKLQDIYPNTTNFIPIKAEQQSSSPFFVKSNPLLRKTKSLNSSGW
jgi:hypothetical protein